MSEEIANTTQETPAPFSMSTSEVPSPQPAPTVSDKINAKAEAIKAAEATPQVPAYSPNYKFKSFDKEYEMDEFVRQAIKDKAAEDRLRSIYEKAYGLDVIKPRYQETREKFQELQGQHQTLTDNIGLLEGYLNQGNLEDFFKTLQIPEQSVYKYVLDKLNYQELSPQQKQQYDQYRQYQNKSLMLDRHNQDLMGKYEQTQVQLRTLELDSVLNRPDIRSIVDAYDSRKGTPGAFKDRVIMEGKSAFHAMGKDLSAEEAVRQVIELMDLVAQQGQVGPNGSTVATPQATTKPPVIPNVAGKGSSPAKKVIKSIDQLRQMAKAMD